MKKGVPSRTACSPLLILCLFFFSVTATPLHAEMDLLDDDALSKITGHGFSSFSVTHENGLDIARMNLDIRATTFTEIDSIKMGHYDNGAGAGWDQNWISTDLGENANHLSLSGFFMEAQFTDLDDAGSRRIESITFGYQSVSGTISTDLQSFSGTIQGAAYDRENLGETVITLGNEVLAFTLDVSEGIRFQIGDAPEPAPEP